MDELKAAVAAATSLDDFQDIGRRCREILIQVARQVFQPSMVPGNEQQPEVRDFERATRIASCTGTRSRGSARSFISHIDAPVATATHRSARLDAGYTVHPNWASVSNAPATVYSGRLATTGYLGIPSMGGIKDLPACKYCNFSRGQWLPSTKAR